MNQQHLSLMTSSRQIRRSILQIAHHAPSDGVHISPALSMADMLAVLYGYKMRYQAENIDTTERDVCILSKGHGALGLYAALAAFQIITAEDLNSFEHNGSVFQVHPTRSTPHGIDFSGGSLAQGLSFGIGLALSRRLKSEPWQTYVIVGDGECNEGAIWEGALLAAHQRLDSLTVLVDRNGLQSDGFTDDVLHLDMAAMWRASGWHVIECDGHDIAQLKAALDAPTDGKPKAIVAHTIKGKGVDFMENNKEFHRNRLSEEQYQHAMSQLGGDA